MHAIYIIKSGPKRVGRKGSAENRTGPKKTGPKRDLPRYFLFRLYICQYHCLSVLLWPKACVRHDLNLMKILFIPRKYMIKRTKHVILQLYCQLDCIKIATYLQLKSTKSLWHQDVAKPSQGELEEDLVLHKKSLVSTLAC